MKKNRGIKKTIKPSRRFPRLKWLVVIIMILLLVFATGFMLIRLPKSVVLAGWFSQAPTHANVNTNTKATSQDIHFEFYTTLPDMHIKSKNKKAKQNAKLFDAATIEKGLAHEIHKHRNKP